MQQWHTIKPSKQLLGTIDIPGDKSISHRSIMFASLSNTEVTITNFLEGEDCLSTIDCFRKLGVEITRDHDTVKVKGNGLHGLIEPREVLDAGNSGTTLRLMMGILSAQPFFSVFTGDHSLAKRPMGRIIKPLSLMGAQIRARANDRNIPLAIMPTEGLHSLDYESPVASAQVKSAILLAGLCAGTKVSVNEPHISRDHTEKMLETFGVTVNRQGTKVSLDTIPTELTAPKTIEVPGDISSAAFWMVAASICPGSDLLLKNVGMNPTRTGIYDALLAMGADITLENERTSGAEPVADMRVRYASLHGITLREEDIPRLIDEIPVLAVAAMFAEGKTVIKGAGELRVKETDRIMAVCQEFGKMGAIIEELPDGMIITGGATLHCADCESYDDHRMAMALAIAGTAGDGVRIANAHCADISYPTFYQELARIGSANRIALAIDGPAGAGKSTVAKQVAKRLGYVYVDTGAMFRVVALKALEAGTRDEEAIARLAESLDLTMTYDDGNLEVFVDGKDVTNDIRTPEVTALVPMVAQIPAVRHSLLLMQREMATKGGIVMDGRDIGTNVLPNAELKIFMTASIEERANRRYLELTAKGYTVDIAELAREIAERDRMDMEREIAPLVQADDAIYLDTTKLSIEEVIQTILSYTQRV